MFGRQMTDCCRCMVLATLILGASDVCAENEVVPVDVEMIGSSRDAAVEACLQEAVKQVNGVVVRSDRREVTSMNVNDDETSTTVDVAGGTRNVSKGVVTGYDVKSVESTADGQVKVRALVKVAKYKSPFGSSRRPKLAVMPFRWVVTGWQIGGDKPEFFRPGEMIAKDVASKITRNFTHSGEFTVLSRVGEVEMRKEERLIDEKSPLVEKVKIGQRMGADYIVIGCVRDAYVSGPVSNVSPLTGIVRTSLTRAFIKAYYQVLVVSTSQIVWTDDLYVELDAQALASCGGVADRAYELLLTRLGDLVSTAIDSSLISPDGAVGAGIPNVTSLPHGSRAVPQSPTGACSPGIRLPGDERFVIQKNNPQKGK